MKRTKINLNEKTMNTFEQDYKNLLYKALSWGEKKPNRTGVDTLSLFNESMNIDISECFPIVTSKKIYFEKGLAEYNWIAQGLSKLNYLHDHGIKWWDEFADSTGDVGKTYGYQLRNFNGEIDQLATVYNEIRDNTRRAHITFWNPSELNQTKLPPCYTGMTFHRINSRLNMSLQLRSSDLFLGLPYDIIVGALFLIDTAKFMDLKPGVLGLQITDAHIYENHISVVKEYLDRSMFPSPKLITFADGKRELYSYRHHGYMPAKLNN